MVNDLRPPNKMIRNTRWILCTCLGCILVPVLLAMFACKPSKHHKTSPVKSPSRPKSPSRHPSSVRPPAFKSPNFREIRYANGKRRWIWALPGTVEWLGFERTLPYLLGTETMLELAETDDGLVVNQDKAVIDLGGLSESEVKVTIRKHKGRIATILWPHPGPIPSSIAEVLKNEIKTNWLLHLENPAYNERVFDGLDALGSLLEALLVGHDSDVKPGKIKLTCASGLKSLKLVGVFRMLLGHNDISALKNLHGLESIILENVKLSEKALDALGAHTRLRRLNLNLIMKDDVKLARRIYLAAGKMPQLQVFSFASQGIECEDLPILAEMRNLEVLESYAYCEMPGSWKFLGTMSKIKSLSIIPNHKSWSMPFERLENLETVELPAVELKREDLAKLDKLHKLERLIIASVDEKPSTGLCPKVLDRIKILTIKSGITTGSLLDCLSENSPLRVLSLISVKATSKNAIKMIGRLRYLELLNLTFIEVDIPESLCNGKSALRNVLLIGRGTGKQDVEKISRCNDLELLDLGETPIIDISIEKLDNLRKLRYLNLSKTKKITDNGVRFLSKLVDLKFLELSGTAVGDPTAKVIAKLPRLEHIGIRNTLVTKPSLLIGSNSKTLRSLNMTNIPYAPGGLSGVERLAGLKNLGIRETKVGDEIARYLGKFKNLRKLDMEKTEITDRTLPAIGRLRRLRSLDLAGKSISDKGFKHLAGLKSIRWLTTFDTSISDDSIKTMLSMKGLYYLVIDGKKVTGRNFHELKKLRCLRILFIRAGNKGNLHKLTGLKNLRVLHLDNKEFDEDFIRRFRKLMPWCEVD